MPFLITLQHNIKLKSRIVKCKLFLIVSLEKMSTINVYLLQKKEVVKPNKPEPNGLNAHGDDEDLKRIVAELEAKYVRHT